MPSMRIHDEQLNSDSGDEDYGPKFKKTKVIPTNQEDDTMVARDGLNNEVVASYDTMQSFNRFKLKQERKRKIMANSKSTPN